MRIIQKKEIWVLSELNGLYLLLNSCLKSKDIKSWRYPDHRSLCFILCLALVEINNASGLIRKEKVRSLHEAFHTLFFQHTIPDRWKKLNIMKNNVTSYFQYSLEFRKKRRVKSRTAKKYRIFRFMLTVRLIFLLLHLQIRSTKQSPIIWITRVKKFTIILSKQYFCTL